jgi:hypothetical protein
MAWDDMPLNDPLYGRPSWEVAAGPFDSFLTAEGVLFDIYCEANHV